MDNIEKISSEYRQVSPIFLDLLRSREIFRNLQFPLIPAVEKVFGPDQLLDAIRFLATEYQGTHFLVRLNQLSTKNSQAFITLATPLADFSYDYQKEYALLDALVDLRPLNNDFHSSEFLQELARKGAIVELDLAPIKSKVIVTAFLPAPAHQSWQLINLQHFDYHENTNSYSFSSANIEQTRQQELVKMAGLIGMELAQEKLFGEIQIEFLQVWEKEKLINYPHQISVLSGP